MVTVLTFTRAKELLDRHSTKFATALSQVEQRDFREEKNLLSAYECGFMEAIIALVDDGKIATLRG